MAILCLFLLTLFHIINTVFNILIFVHLQVCADSKDWNPCTICTLHGQRTYIEAPLNKTLAAQLLKFPALDEIWSFITTFKLSHHWANIRTYFSSSPGFYMTHPCHAPSFEYPNQMNIAQLMKINAQSSPASRHFLPLWCKYSHHHILNEIWNFSFPWPTTCLIPLV